MKTSNIILLSILGAILLSITIGMIVVRTQIGGFSDAPISGVTATETHTVEPFTKLMVTDGLQVEYTQAPVQMVTVEADSSQIKLVETKVENGELKVFLNKPIHGNRRIVVKVSAPTLEAINLNGGSAFTNPLPAKFASLSVDLSGGARMELTADMEALSYDASSGATANLKGSANMMKVDTSSGSVLEAEGFIAQNADVSASSGSVLNIHVTGEIDVDASSGSVIHCSGNPKVDKMDTSSGAVFDK
jgi:hypothetical protein